MFCEKCGNQMNDNASFCSICGYCVNSDNQLNSVMPQNGGAQVYNGAPQYCATQQYSGTPQSGGTQYSGASTDAVNGGLVALSILIPLAGVITGIVNLCRGKSKSGSIYLATGIVAWIVYIIIIMSM